MEQKDNKQCKCENCNCGKTPHIVYYPAIPAKPAPRPKPQEKPMEYTGWKKFDYYFHQLILTFTTKKSLFSSKKIERFLVFMSFIIITIAYLILNLNELKALELIEIIGLWLAYGGYNTYQNGRDKDKPGDTPPPMSGDELPILPEPEMPEGDEMIEGDPDMKF